ncbi:MAG: sodium:proton antiporter [Deltaproteobacteria bacterium]|nr:sodium:proton antiporter [Deltaproteobacteria bacterium]
MVIRWWGLIPFVALLACIATAPLIPGVRERWQSARLQLGVALGLGLPTAVWLCVGGENHAVIHAAVEYGHFITLLACLYVATGGISVEGDIQASPRNNALMLAVGALVASFIGTTGAAMLLVRPLLSTNRERELKAHIFVFAVIIVANTGGLLTPLGDPPLFLGFLRGVPFLWTLHLTAEWLFVNGLLLLSFYGLDRQMYAKESATAIARDDAEIVPISIRGKRHLAWLLAIVVCAATLPSVDLESILEGHASWSAWLPLREAAMIGAACGSWLTGRRARRAGHEFKWEPILEVAALFSGIFLTMVPALRWVAQVAPSLPLNAIWLFGLTGGLSSVLDNAPTYAVFFELAKGAGGTDLVAGVRSTYLTAVSLGAVLCGAMTYIGNGPNFMVKSIAESGGVRMPSFGGYVFRWAVPYLLPVLVAMVLVFLTEGWMTRGIGVVLAVVIAAVHASKAARNRDPHGRRPA